MLGSVVGTGNIWRFPRIVANHATEGGKIMQVDDTNRFTILFPFRSIGVPAGLVHVPVGLVHPCHPD